MAISDERARELAGLLPKGLSCTDRRERLLCVAQVLCSLTDRDHPLSNSDIRKVLRSYFGHAAAENSVGQDIASLASAGCLGLSVHTTPSGSWCERTGLGPADVRLLLNSVQANRFLTEDQGNGLEDALLGLVSCHQEFDISGEVIVEQRVRETQQHVFDNVDAIARALREGRKLSFTYAYNDFAGTPQPLAGDDGQMTRVETPVALIFSGGNYYLESYAKVPWRHGQCVMRSRVDRMYDVRVADEPADDNDEVARARRTARRRKEESFDMMGGTERIIFLRVKGYCTNTMLDTFGYGLVYRNLQGEPGDRESSMITCVPVGESPTLYRWLSMAGEGIVVSRPPMSLRPWRRTVGDKTPKDLEEDYRAVLEGLRDYLRRAWAPYEGR